MNIYFDLDLSKPVDHATKHYFYHNKNNGTGHSAYR